MMADKLKDFNDSCEIVGILGLVVERSMDKNISIDVIIESLAGVLGATICEKHGVNVHSPLACAQQTVLQATEIVLANKVG